jgi:hypothetical protein
MPLHPGSRYRQLYRRIDPLVRDRLCKLLKGFLVLYQYVMLALRLSAKRRE